MSMINCWFWKKKKKQCNNEDNYSQKGPKIIYAVPQVPTCDFNRPIQSHQQNSDSFNTDNNHPPKVHKKREIKSYPTSPVKVKHERNSQDIPFNNSVPLVYVAKMSGPSLKRLSQSPTAPAPEPFPFQIPKPEDTLPRRSSLFYNIKNINDLPDSLKWSDEKQVEDQEKHVTIKLPDDNGGDADANEPVKRTTVVRLRPSSVSQSPGEYVKQMTVRASITDPQSLTPGRFVANMPVRPSRDTPVLITSDGKKLKPLGSDKIRTSITRDPQRSSVVRQSFTKDNGLRSSLVTKQGIEQVVCPVPVMHSKRNSVTREERRKSVTVSDEHNPNERRNSIRARDESSFTITKNNPTPVVYAVPTIPTRGRSRSVLQQSVKSLTSRESADYSAINKKNIRRSMDTDVFSSHSQRRSVQRNQPGYINMERGQPVLVSELLNPISSIFVSDLKDPVPKDPLNKPREYNNFVKPRKPSVQQTVPKQIQPEKKMSSKAPVIVYQDPRTKQTRSSRYRNDSSSSEESIEVYRKKSKRSSPNRYAVYSTQVDSTVLPLDKAQDTKETGKNPPLKKKGKPLEMNNNSSNNDFCGLSIEQTEAYHPQYFHSIPKPKMISSAQQTDLNDMDLLCYPTDSLPKDSPLETESGSKLRWRIIIKR